MPANCACSSNCALHYRTYTTGQSATNMVHASFLPSRRVRLLLGLQLPIHHRRSQEVPLKAREMDRNVRILKRDVYLNRCPRLSMLSGCPKLSGSYSRVLAHLFLRFNHFSRFSNTALTLICKPALISSPRKWREGVSSVHRLTSASPAHDASALSLPALSAVCGRPPAFAWPSPGTQHSTAGLSKTITHHIHCRDKSCLFTTVF